MISPGTLDVTEPHPAARDAFAWVKQYLLKDTTNAHLLLEAFASVGMSGNRLGEICGETLRRVLAGEMVSDRYLLGLAWTLRGMETIAPRNPAVHGEKLIEHQKQYQIEGGKT